MVGFCSSPRFVEHDTGAHHPERPDRIRVIHKAVRDAGLISSPNPFPDFKLDLGLSPLGLPPLIEIEPIPATESQIELVHPHAVIDRVKHHCELNGVLDQGDTPCERRSFNTALLAAGAAITACDAVMRGDVKRAFVAARPPGHHAEPDRPMGFCLFSNIAIAARHLQKQYGLKRIAIVDFDVHHGNGTQAAVDDDPSVLFISLHQHPSTCYPGSGHEWETGIGPGRGYTINLPFYPGADDHDYMKVFESRVVPELEEYKPEMLLISAGFDAHRDDPLAQVELSETCFEWMTRMLVEVSEQSAGGKIVSLLEGGYNLRALGRSVIRHLVGLM